MLHSNDGVENGRDQYGEESTPLFVDTIDTETGEGVHYDSRSVPGGGRLSNFAAQQPFFRTLIALAQSTRNANYHNSAAETISWIFENLTDQAGLPY